MSKNKSFGKIEVETPCAEKWSEMRGTNQMRFCSHCDLHVNNLSAMSRKQAMKIVRQANGRICVRYVKNPRTNQPVFRDKLYQISRRTGIAAGVLGASLSLSAANYAQSETKTVEAEPQVTRLNQLTYFDPVETDAENKKVESETASVSGTITDPNGAVIPNVAVTLTNAETQETRSATSNEEGFYEFKSVAAGNYSLKAEGGNGFETMIFENIAVAENGETKTDVQMNIGEQYATMGGMAAIEYANPLFRAVSNDELDEAKILIARGERVNAKDENYNNVTPLFLAVENGNAEIAAMLLDFGAKVNAKDDDRQTPLMRLDEDASPALVNLLIKHGAKINLTDNDGDTALILAAGSVKPEVLQILLTNGAQVNAQNKEGTTALMNAAEYDDLEAVRALILAGADMNLKNKEGKTARNLASDAEIEKLLETHGAQAEGN